jgi:hypothetical protein
LWSKHGSLCYTHPQILNTRRESLHELDHNILETVPISAAAERPKDHRQRPAIQVILMTGKYQLQMPFKRFQEAV